MNKKDTKKIEELIELRDSLYKQMLDINKQISEIELSTFKNYEGKFIYYKNYGYMFVTWQKHEKKCPFHGDERMFFQGYVFRGSSSPYIDDFWLELDGLKEWYIPIKEYIEDSKSNNIKVISKDEFISKMKELVNDISEKMEDMLKVKIENYEKDV